MNHLLASLMFCTRLPWWRLRQVPSEAFQHVADWWPLAGWLTGGLMAATYFVASLLGFPSTVGALMAIASRLLLTGALHEDGLADFCDGFGGGTTRERTLSIMKDSHIGTYGVLGLIVTLGLLWASVSSLVDWVLLHSDLSDVHTEADVYFRVAVILLMFDVAAKSAASLISGQLPYARTAAEAKGKVVYAGRDARGWFFHALRLLLALSLPFVLCWQAGLSVLLLLLPIPFVVEWWLMLWMKSRLGGYTGDCCGALFILCELSLYLSLVLVDSY